MKTKVIEGRVVEATPEQVEELRRLKSYFPYRIVWGMIHKETGEWSCTANPTKAQMNREVRNGHYVITLHTKKP